MTTLRERVGGERRRLKAVREALSAAVADKANGDESFVPFYIAITDYIDTSMGRLHAQDVKMGDMIRDKLGKLDDGSTKALGELDERLAGNQQHLSRLVAAKKDLEKNGVAAIEHFEEVAAAYTNYIVTNMGHHGGTTDLAAKLFNQDDWEYMAGVTDEETRTERKLYDQVFAALPRRMEAFRPSA